MTTRRRILQLAAAGLAVALSGCEIEDVARLVDDVRTDARLGVIAHFEDYGPRNLKTLERLFRFYRQEGVDAVAVAGSVTRGQTDVIRQAWMLVFGPDSKTRLILEAGRHEVKGFAFGVAKTAPARPCDVLTFHGEGMGALTDDLAFFDPDFGIVFAGSLSRITVPEGFSRNGRAPNGRDRVDCRQGLLVSVYAETISLRRLDFSKTQPVSGFFDRSRIYAEDVAPALVLPRTGPWTREKATPPEFWPDTALCALPGTSGAEKIYTLRWPPVQKRFTGERAFCYEVGLHRMKPGADKPSRAVRSRTVLSEAYHLSELRDTEPVGCVFRQRDLAAAGKGGAVVLSVTPIGPLGDRGRTLFTASFTP